MFFIKNSIKNIYRYRSKYKSFGILYLIIILVFSICTNAFIQMSRITDNIIREYAGVMKFDTFPRGGTGKTELRLAKEDFFKFKGREYIDDIKIFKYVFHAGYLKENASQLKKELHLDGEIIRWGASLQPFIIYGYNMSLLHLEKDKFKLEKGRMFEKDDEIVIYKNRLYQEFGKGWNDLDLGDKVVLKNDDGIYKEFTVVGITEQDPDDTKDTYRYMIYTTLESAEYFDSIASEGENVIQVSSNPKSTDDFISLGYEALIYLESPDHFIPLRNELSSEGVRIKSFFSDANALLNLTNAMQTWSVIFMVIAGAVILCVTIISTNILLNTRKYEMAVLCSTGMKKGRLIISCLIENLTFIWGITVVSLIAATFISPIFTGGVLDEMKSLLSAEMFESITNSAYLQLQNTVIIFGATTIVVALSLIVTCINIIRFEPLKIFNKQY